MCVLIEQQEGGDVAEQLTTTTATDYNVTRLEGWGQRTDRSTTPCNDELLATIDSLQLKLSLLEACSDDYELRSTMSDKQLQTLNNSAEYNNYSCVKSLQSSAGDCRTVQRATDAEPLPPLPDRNDCELQTTEISAKTNSINFPTTKYENIAADTLSCDRRQQVSRQTVDRFAEVIDGESECRQKSVVVGDLQKNCKAGTSEQSTHNVRYYFFSKRVHGKSVKQTIERCH